MSRRRSNIGGARVTNGYGYSTSVLSASNIGLSDHSSIQRQATVSAQADAFKDDALFQMQQLKLKHPSRKVLHLQSCYPDTVKRLEENGKHQRKMTPPQLKTFSKSDRTFTAPSDIFLSTVEIPEVVEVQHKAYKFAHEKMIYNRHKGQIAEVDQIITGTSPLPEKVPLFPQNATHTQLLGVMKHKPPDPNEAADLSHIKTQKKWLGEYQGWEQSPAGTPIIDQPL